MLPTTSGELHMQAQQSARHWPDILWFLFVSVILGLTCGVAVGGAALLLAAPAYGAESAADAIQPEESNIEETDTGEPEDAPLVCTTFVLRDGEATVVCRPRNSPALYVRRDARCCSPS
jgi:hypothetical protein